LGLEKQTLTVPETARVLGIGRNSAYEAVRTGEIPSLKIGRRVLVPRLAVERLLAGAAIPHGHPAKTAEGR
jgi:excisionase family DNA binding protein